MAGLSLAMHMANELLSVPVAAATLLLAAAAIALAAGAARRRIGPERLPLVGVMGAFVFAAQMINFPVLPGTSGHLGDSQENRRRSAPGLQLRRCGTQSSRRSQRG